MRFRFYFALLFAICSLDAFAQTPLPNPDLQISCPYTIIFVLDESGSIAGVGADDITAVVRSAAIDLMTALSGSGSQVAVIEFNSQARRAIIGGTTDYQVVDAAYITAFTNYINDAPGNTASADHYDPEDYSNTQYFTNWEDAFIQIQSINSGSLPSGGFAELIIFFTDGNPNAYINPQGGVTQGSGSAAQALLEATAAANTVKTQGSHIFVVGLPNPTLTETNIHQISDTSRYPDIEPSFIEGDYSVSTSQTLQEDLERIAASVCKIDLDLEKTASDTTPCSGDTVVFTLTLTNQGLDNASNITVTDSIPNGFNYLSDNGGSTTNVSGGVVTWSLDSLNAGQAASIHITVTVNNSGDYTNITQVIAHQGDEVDSTNNQDTLAITLLLDCDDGNSCTNDFCLNGICQNDTISCDDEDACTLDDCDSLTGCTNTTVVCDDGNDCTIDSCDNGICVFSQIDCDDGDPCTVDTCVNGQCVFNPILCDDGDPCTVDSCSEGVCQHQTLTPCNIRFPCTGSFFLSQYDNSTPPTTLYDVVVDTNITFSQLTIYNLEINAIGFNPNDNYIYGIDQNTLNVIRMFSDGTFQDLGQPANLPINAYISADFDSNGNFVITGGSSDAIVTISITGSSVSVVTTATLFYNPPIPGSNLNVADIVFHPATGKCYGYDFGTDKLVEIDPNSGEAILISPSPFLNPSIGALFFKPNGDLFGYGVDTLYSIDIQTGDIQAVSPGPSANARDGCSCPFSVDMFKEVFPTQVCLGDTVTYRISIHNQTQGPLDSIEFFDLLDANLIISSLPNNLFGGTVAPGSGLGTSTLTISGMTIPEDSSTFQFNAVVSASIASGDTLYNQAKLTGLPQLLGDSVLSDDPSTIAFDDSTALIVITECDDNNACTDDICENGGCIQIPIDCDDEDACTNDACDSVAGCVFTDVVCDDDEPCTNDECVDDGCVFEPIIADAGDDASICIGDSAQLNATGGLIYSWSPASGLSATDIANPVASPTVTTSYMVTIQATGINVILNGDFTGGASGFTSDYNLDSNLQPEGNYFVDTDPSAHHGSFSACVDHTSGSGNMLIVNGSGTPGVNVWCQTINISQNTDYAFSTWVTSVFATSPAELQFFINGSLIGPVFSAPSTVCVWNQFFTTWNSSSDTTANICIVNQNTVFQGNDFALDDISFAPICVITDTVTVTVNLVYNDTVDATICPGTPYELPDGSFVNTPGIYPVTLSSIDGCDSTIVTNLSIQNCDDDNLCNGVETCDPVSGCQPGTPLICDDNDVCNGIETCDPADGCQPGTPLNCDDGDVCTLDSCDGQTGCFYTAVICDDNDPCTVDNCVSPATGCTFTPVNCDDGNLCTMDTCINGICSNAPLDCDDAILCTNDICIAGQCMHTPIPNCCVDVDDCTEGDVCTAEACIGNVCYYADVCCDDGDNCTWDYCDNGECIFVPKFCEDSNPCTDNDCVNGQCDFPPTNCDDNDLCTTDGCINGNCVHTSITCNDGDPCTTDFCDNGCRYLPIPCSDGDRCTRDSCVQGDCISFPINCNDGDACTIDFCVNGFCRHLQINCSDGDLCTTDDCFNGICGHSPVQCDDGDRCTYDECVGVFTKEPSGNS